MLKTLSRFIKPFIKPVIAATLAIVLVFGQAQGALAAGSGGRIGGGSFRMPSRTAPPSRTYTPSPGGYGGGYYFPGGGFGYGYPFLVPTFGIGGAFTGLFTLLIFISIAGFLVRAFRSTQSSDGLEGYSSNPTVSLTKLQVGLLSQARSLQTDLNRIAEMADTGSSEGLAQVLQETTLALLRHPEYWVYAGQQNQLTSLQAAENQFNRLALSERSKFNAETLSNVDTLLKHADAKAALPSSGELATLDQAPGEYIVVTLLVATQGKLELPRINSSQELRQALSQLGSVPSDKLLALEVLWTPQQEGDTLSSDEVIAQYPDLALV